MPKHLVTAIGIIVSLSIIALGVALVALPLYFQAVDVHAQTATVASTNAIYQAQVDGLREEEENLDQINADVDGLRAQIPATGKYDDVFEVVGRAAEASGVTLTAVSAGEQVAFVARANPAADPAAIAPSAETAPAPDDETSTEAGETTTEPEPAAPVSAARQQVDFAINAAAADMNQVTAFLDALRAGPRLLNSINTITTPGAEGGFLVQVTALTYIDTQGRP